jgi:predicted dehydrogenase
MRRFDPNVAALREQVRQLGKPLFVRATNLAGGVKAWTGSGDDVLHPSDCERSAAAALLGTAWGGLANRNGWNPSLLGYAQTLLQLAIHDLNLLDFIFGPIASVSWVEPAPNGALTASLSLIGGVACILHVAPLMSAPWMWHQQLEVIYPGTVLRLEFGSPFLSVNLSRVVEIGAPLGRIAVQSMGAEDPFGRLIEHAVGCLRSGEADDSAQAAIRDLVIIEEFMKRLANRR